jgi:hypothetical protein
MQKQDSTVPVTYTDLKIDSSRISSDIMYQADDVD